MRLHVGVFTFSDEEGTSSFDLAGRLPARTVEPGCFVTCEVTEARPYDLVASPRAPRPPAHSGEPPRSQFKT
jgi:hypothetical protein